MPEDRTRLRERASILEFQERDPPVRIYREKIGLACSAIMKPVILECEVDAEPPRGQSNFVAIA